MSTSDVVVGRLARAGHGASVYNEVGLLQKFEEICLPGDYAWAETLVVQPEGELNADIVNDDLKREVALYVISSLLFRFLNPPVMCSLIRDFFMFLLFYFYAAINTH
jgi:hypothetical protein